MTKARSRLTIQALEIIKELEKMKHPFLRDFETSEPQKLSDRVRDVMPKKLRELVTITIKSDRIYIGTKKSSREAIMKAMIRKLAMSTDSERLYEEALAIVGWI